MRKDVQVSVLGILDAGGGPEAILTRTTGICSPQGGGYQVSYRELDEHGNATDNLLFLSQTEIRIDRSGSISGSFRFIPGERTEALYRTPFGDIGFLAETESCTVETDGSGLEARLEYRLEYRLYEGGRLFSQNTLSVYIGEDGGDGPAPDHTTRRNHI